MMAEDHYDTPWEFLARPNSVRLSTADIRLSTAHGDVSLSPEGSPSLSQSPSFVQQLVHIGNSVVENRQRSREHRKREEARSDESILERNVDRVEAEKRLEARHLGDFLLRYRAEGSAALSLKSSKGVLHIKIERRGDKWVIGEGPCFRSISSAVHYYRRHALPIRGADHLILNQQVKIC